MVNGYTTTPDPEAGLYYPYESIAQGTGWFDAAPLEDGVREQIGRRNAERLLRL
jgi:predicted TIM-barrel fold metal-dependent hydrolase